MLNILSGQWRTTLNSDWLKVSFLLQITDLNMLVFVKGQPEENNKQDENKMCFQEKERDLHLRAQMWTSQDMMMPYESAWMLFMNIN